MPSYPLTTTLTQFASDLDNRVIIYVGSQIFQDVNGNQYTDNGSLRYSVYSQAISENYDPQTDRRWNRINAPFIQSL